MTKISIDKVKLWIVFILGVGVLAALDLWLKAWAAGNLQNNPPRTLIYGLLGLRYTENTGMVFGFLSGNDWTVWVASIMTVVVMIVLLIYYYKLPTEKKSWLIRIPLIMVFAGAVGNLFDRITIGAVRDMIEFLFMNFAIFNLADVFIVTGTISWVIFEIFIVKVHTDEKEVDPEITAD